MRFCTHCGAAAEPAERSCSSCGSLHALASPTSEDRRCDFCAAAIEPGWRHCADCGNATAAATSARMKRTSIAAEAPAFTPVTAGIRADEPASPAPEDRWPAKLHP